MHSWLRGARFRGLVRAERVSSEAPGFRLSRLTVSPAMARENAGAQQGPLAYMPFHILQHIIVQLPLRTRLTAGCAAKFIWLAASSPADASGAASAPLGELLPPTGLGVARRWEPAWEAAVVDRSLTVYVGERPLGKPCAFPPPAASRSRNWWSLAGHAYVAGQTPKGKPKSVKGLALCGGGTGNLHGATKWIGVNFVRGVQIHGGMELAAKSSTTLVGCHVRGSLKVMAHASLLLIGCRIDSGAIAVKGGSRSKLVMRDCRVSGSKYAVSSRGFDVVDIQNCIFPNRGLTLTASSDGNAAMRKRATPSKVILQDCTFLPPTEEEFRLRHPDHAPLPNPDDQAWVRARADNGLNLWYAGPVAHEFICQRNSFSYEILFWDILEGTIVLDNNIFHRSLRDEHHVRVTGLNPVDFPDHPNSSFVLQVLGAPSWLRWSSEYGAEVRMLTAE